MIVKGTSRRHRMRLVFVVVLAVLLGPTVVTGQDDPVWQMEKSYWRHVKAGDIERYTSLWHEDFVAWPSFADKPVRGGAAANWLREIKDKGFTVRCQLRREAVQYFGDVAVAHYACQIVYEHQDGSVASQGTYRITHTWMKVEAQWKIIGGMSTEVGPTED
jgi:ketosteroid isomerase-like protein